MAALFRKKPRETPTVVHPDVGAVLRPAAGPPPAGPRGEDGRERRQALRVEGVPPDVRLFPADDPPDSAAAFALPAAGDLPGCLFLRLDDGFRFEVWDLAPEEDLRPGRRWPDPVLHPDQAEWKGVGVLEAIPLPAGRALLAIRYFAPRPRCALVRADRAARAFSWIAEADPSIREPHRHFVCRCVPGDVALVLHFTGRTRKRAELYYNRRHHLRVFTPDRPDGLEVLDLGLDVGAVADFVLRDRVLHLETFDPREARDPPRRHWTLDLSAVLPAG